MTEVADRIFIRFGVDVLGVHGSLDAVMRRLRVLARDHGPVEEWLVVDPPTWEFPAFSTFRKTIYDWRFDR